MPQHPQRLGLGDLVLTVAVALVCASAPIAAADDFSDFRVPTHTLKSGTLGILGHGDLFHEDQPADYDAESYALGTLDASGSWLLDSDPLRLSVGVGAFTNASRRHGERRYGPGVLTIDRLDRNVQEDLALSVDVRQYPWDVPVGWRLALNAGSGFEQLWSRYYGTNHTDDSLGTSLYTNLISATRHDASRTLTGQIGAGYGRVRDATAVYTAHLIEQRLLRTHTLRRPLTHAGIQRLIALLYVSGDYGTIHDRPLKYLWADIEAILRDDGALSGPVVDATGVLKATESEFPDRLSISRSAVNFVRQRGYFIGAVVQGSHQYRSGHREYAETLTLTGQPPAVYTFSTHGGSSVDRAAWGPTAELHMPLGLRWQVDLNAFGNVSLHPAALGAYSAGGSATVAMLVADRFLASAQADYRRDRPRNEPLSWDSRIAGEADYDVEDHLRIGLIYSMVQQRDLGFDDGVPRFIRQSRLDLALTYHFLGVMSIPGVTPPVRLAANP